MAVPPLAIPGHQEQDDVDGDDEFTFPTPPPLPQVVLGKDGRRVLDLQFHPPCAASASSSPPVWLLSSPIRRSFSAADCAASPWRDRVLLARRQRRNGACSPALSDYAAGAGFCFDDDEGEEDEEEEERMDSLWEDLNDHDAAARSDDLFFGSLDVSRRRSVAGVPDDAERAAKGQRAGAPAAVLGASRSSRRRPPGLVVMMRALKKMFVAHKGKSRVHRDEPSTASASASASASSSSCSNTNNPSKKG